jgi:hypothetical protein
MVDCLANFSVELLAVEMVGVWVDYLVYDAVETKVVQLDVSLAVK